MKAKTVEDRGTTLHNGRPTKPTKHTADPVADLIPLTAAELYKQRRESILHHAAAALSVAWRTDPMKYKDAIQAILDAKKKDSSLLYSVRNDLTRQFHPSRVSELFKVAEWRDVEQFLNGKVSYRQAIDRARNIKMWGGDVTERRTIDKNTRAVWKHFKALCTVNPKEASKLAEDLAQWGAEHQKAPKQPTKQARRAKR